MTWSAPTGSSTFRVAATGASSASWPSASYMANHYGGLVNDPARAVVVGHVAGQQAPAVGGDPLELAGELHPGVVTHRAPRPPLVERPACPRRPGHPGRGHQSRITGIV